MFDRSQAGRAFFEGLIRDHPRPGTPDQVALFFNRRISRRTPGTFRTGHHQRRRPSTVDLLPLLTAQAVLQGGAGAAHRTVICDTRDFGIGRRVCADNWHALWAVGESAHRRLCDAEAAAAHPAPDVATFLQVTRPTTDEGQYAPGLRFGEPRVMALLAALASLSHLVAGFTNRQLTERVAALLNASYTSKQATYDLRRLKRKGLITRRPHSPRYDLTPTGQRVALLFTKTYGRVLTPGLAAMDPAVPAEISTRSPLGRAWRQLQRALDDFIDLGLAPA